MKITKEEIRTINGFADDKLNYFKFEKWINTMAVEDRIRVAINLMQYGREYQTLKDLAKAMEVAEIELDTVMMVDPSIIHENGVIICFREEILANEISGDSGKLSNLLKLAFYFYSMNDNRQKFYPGFAPKTPAKQWWKLWMA
jgi:hypothetical protein